MANLSELPEELIDLFLKRLLCVQDLVRSGAVCKSWRSSVLQIRKKQKQPCFAPCLMLTDDETDMQNLRSFSCLSTKQEFTIQLPNIRDRRCWGSPFGWLVTFGLDLSIHLLNPFSGVRLSLPHQSTLEHQYKRTVEPEFIRQNLARKFVLSSSPSLTLTGIVIAICDPVGRLYFARPGDETWTSIETPRNWHVDAIFFKGKIYTVNLIGILTVCDIDIDAPHPKGSVIGSSPYPNYTKCKVYLVEMCEELHLVVRKIKYTEDKFDPSCDHYTTKSFCVYRFDFQTKSWIEVASLGDHALFVGSSTSFVISTLDFPEFKRNAIYHSDDHSEDFSKSYCDMSIYDFETKTFEPFYFGTIVLSKFCRPLFIIPTL